MAFIKPLSWIHPNEFRDKDYNTVIDIVLEHGHLHYFLEDLALLDRIKDKDLPLFINFKWTSFITKEIFLSRLKG